MVVMLVYGYAVSPQHTEDPEGACTEREFQTNESNQIIFFFFNQQIIIMDFS